MRLTAGKIYFWGGVTIAMLTVWNRRSTNNLRTIVDSMKEEKMKEAEYLRQYQPASTAEMTLEQKRAQMLASRPLPASFNPYYQQQQQEYVEANPKA